MTVGPVEELVNAVDVPVIASGGVATTDDGTAFYEGHMSYAEAKEAAT